MTSETRHCFFRRLCDPVGSLFRLLWTLDEDPVADPRLGMKSHLRDLVLTMPDRAYSRYRNEIDFLKTAPYEYLMDHIFPYRRILNGPTLEVGWDGKSRLPYVVHDSRKLYFPRKMPLPEVERMYRTLTEEEGLLGTGCLQKSPHQYVCGEYRVEEGDILLDIGSAEGLFAFHHAPVAKRIYLFEGLKEWRKPLAQSFAEYAEKTTIVSRFLGTKTSRSTIRLNDVLDEKDDATYFMKLDIEGAERSVLGDCQEFLRSHRVKISCCTYHRQDDAEYLSDLLSGLGYRTAFTDGYMLHTINGVHYPYFRRGVIYARNDGGPLP